MAKSPMFLNESIDKDTASSLAWDAEHVVVLFVALSSTQQPHILTVWQFDSLTFVEKQTNCQNNTQTNMVTMIQSVFGKVWV